MKDRNKTENRRNKKISRRDFLGAAAAAAAFTIVPRHVLGGPGHTPPSEKLNIACVGTGGQGISDMKILLEKPAVHVVAVCDVSRCADYSAFYFGGTAGREPARNIVDSYYASRQTSGAYKACAAYKDFNVMLHERSDIDAVLVATPDHVHAVASMAAIKMGKHVYCEKPLTYSVYEARTIAAAARRHKVVTQMGIQLHATTALKTLVEMLQSGVIGKVREVHLWSNKPSSSPLVTERPKETPPVPPTLDWDLWLGPAPFRPYHPSYVPYRWRYWRGFGTGRLGDMGCHIFDPAFWALRLKSPATIEASSTPVNSATYPLASVVRYEFAVDSAPQPVTITWYDGGIYPFRPQELEQGRNLPDQGGLYIGEYGTILAPHGAGPRLVPESKMTGFKPPEPSLPRDIDHYEEWVRACKGDSKPLADFDYSGPLTETVLLGNIAVRTGQKLYWDAPNMKFTNAPDANQLLHRKYRHPWTL
ncbi:MAG: Gfo/Idh/MocA family oxidoreductase [Planctomycetota bacterium]|nr:MAG: Gfo/Idh/MocA family oxidoreductase [Planctomycetota bacterium]